MAAIKYARDDIKTSYTSFSTAACCCCSLLFIDHSFPTLHIVGCRFLVQVSGYRAVLKCTKSSHSPTIVPKLHKQKRLLIVLAVWYMTQATHSLIFNQEHIRMRTGFPPVLKIGTAQGKLLMLLTVHVTSVLFLVRFNNFCPDYGLLLELHTLTLVAILVQCIVQKRKSCCMVQSSRAIRYLFTNHIW